MRAKDLKTDGTTYYYTTQDTWLKWTHQAEQVRVLDATPGRWSYDRRAEQWTRRPGGQDVLIEVLAKGGNAPRRMAVRTQTLRGEWDACVEELAAVRRARQREQQREHDRMAAMEKPCDDARDALRDLGIEAYTQVGRLGVDVIVSHVHAPALLAAAQHLLAIGWKWEPPAAE